MKMLRKSVIVAACLLAANSAHAQLGGLGNMLGGSKASSTGGDIGGDVNSFMQKSVSLSELASRALLAINSAFASDTSLAEVRAKYDAANKISDPQERQARMAEAYKSLSAETQRLVESGEMEKRMGTLDADKKKLVGSALLNFGIGALQAVDLAKHGQNLVQRTAANPMQLPKVVPVKDALPMLGKVAGDAGGFMVTVVKLAKGADISVPAVKADSKPADITV